MRTRQQYEQLADWADADAKRWAGHKPDQSTRCALYADAIRELLEVAEKHGAYLGNWIQDQLEAEDDMRGP